MKQNYNNESLARLGHGKWKSALGHTLLIIGMVLMSLGVYAQTPSTDIPAGLKMKKTWVADDPLTNTSGKVVLETYVTGSEITTSFAVPNDIVIVVDQSGSMDENFGNGQTRLQALRTAVTQFINNVLEDAQTTGANHKIALVGFASGDPYFQSRSWNQPSTTPYVYYNNRYYYNLRYDWENTELLSTATVTPYADYSSATCQITQNQYRDALVTVNNNGTLNTRLNNISSRIQASGGTGMNYGLEMAYGVLNNRTETTFNTPEGPKPRGQIVVFFTDGFPGYMFPDNRFAEYRSGTYVTSGPPYYVYEFEYRSKTVADDAVEQANNLKTNGATIFSIGIFSGASPTAAYQTTKIENAYTNPIYYDYWNSGDAAANGLMHMISSNYGTGEVGMAASWSSETESSANVANRFVEHDITDDQGNVTTWKPKYFVAGNPEDLKIIFTSIASDSGAEPIEMSAGTIVQDEVSANFTLPAGANINDIEIYAVKCTGGTIDDDENVTSCTFVTGGGDVFGTKTTYAADGTTIRYLTLNADGVVVEGNNLPENRLDPKGPDGTANTDDDLVVFTTNTDGNQQISLTGFNFANMFCGPIIINHQVTGWQGRKLVIKIPIEVADGVWGDGVATNGPMSFVLPDGGTVAYSFECPITNVMGSVWTEVVTEEPDNFNPMDIDSPEDLAWFISRVNGRIHYNDNNTIASEPTLNGKLTADIDMSAHNWVPIGCGFMCNNNNQFIDASGEPITDNYGDRVKLSYQGTFDGNGHVITGLKNNASKFYKVAEGEHNDVVVFPGMFSNVTGTVHDVFILDSDFRGKYHNSGFIHHGILADTLTGGTIYNCEAAGRMTCNNDEPTKDVNLIYGGLVGLNDGGTIYNSMAMAELTCYTIGGAVGENRGGSFKNGFTNGLYNYIGEDGNNAKPIGGLAAINTGTIDNCYVRFVRNNQNLNQANFGMLYGSNTGTVTNCYTPELSTFSHPSVLSETYQININESVPNQGAMNPYTLPVTPTFYNMFVNDNMTGGSWGTLGSYNVYENGTTLKDKLNKNKGNDGATWKRTTAGNYDVAHGSGNINEDHPVLQLPGYTCLGSADGIRIDYAHNLSDMLHRHNSGALNENTHISNTYTSNNPNYYKVTDHAAINGGAINLFTNEDNRSTAKAQKEQSTDANVVVYIDENISLLQDNNSTIEAYTGQTLKSFVPDGKERWHFVSSSLENSKFGISYGINSKVEHNWEPNPCNMALSESYEDHALFPIDLRSYNLMDFYCFLERAYHWINFRRNKLSHWHMDNYTQNIPYLEQESEFVKGKGYLLSIDMSTWASYDKDAQFLQNRGTLNNGPINIPVTYTAANEWTKLAGYNLLGNPYQSYLDFDEFVRINTTGDNSLWNDGDTYAQTYAMYDPSTDKYVQYKSGATENEYTGSRYINMHQGFFIQTSKDNTQAHFTNGMRVIEPDDENYPGFRGEKPAYPLINFIVTDNEGNSDVAVLEVNRPENDGAKKLRMGSPAGRIYFRYDNTNMAIFFRDNAEGHQTLNFSAEEDGNFTLNWERANDNFRTLTLVDNITGIKTDMLTHDHYTFEGRVDDYNTRFKIVFGEMDTNEEEPVLEHFAFFDHGNLIVNGTGHFEVVDVLGRVVYATELTDTQNTVSLPSNVRGVCMLCFTRNNETKVQKMVIQ